MIFFLIYRECTRLCEGIGLRAHTFTKINKDKEKFNPKLAQKFGNNDYFKYSQFQIFIGIVVCGVPHVFKFNPRSYAI